MKNLVVILTIAIAGLGTGAVYLYQQLAAERSTNAQLQDRIVALEIRQEATAVMPAAATRTETPSPAPMPQPAAAPAAQSGAQPQNSPMNATREMLSTQAGQDMTRTMLRSVLAQQYPDIGKELGLTPEQVTEFFDMLTRHQMDLTNESMDLLTGGGDPAAMQELQRKTELKQQQNEAEVATLLGSKYPKFQEYQGTQAARQQVSQLQNTLGTSGITQLTDTQKQSLITALGAEQKRINEERLSAPAATRGGQAGSPNYLDQQLQQATEQSRRMVDAASGHLNAQQLDSYRKMLDQQLEMVRSMMGMMAPSPGGSGK